MVAGPLAKDLLETIKALRSKDACNIAKDFTTLESNMDKSAIVEIILVSDQDYVSQNG